MRRIATALTATALLLVACGDSKSEESGTTGEDITTSSNSVATTALRTTSTSLPAATTSTEAPTGFAARRFDVFVPSGYDEAVAAPLIILLHGFGVSGQLQEILFQLQPQAEARGFLYVHPDGTFNPTAGANVWNATDACCDDTQAVDDTGYLDYIIDQVSAQYNVDPARIYLIGHSNGGFMSYRMACDRADRIAAIVSLAGATFADPALCAPSQPVSVLQIHGTDDTTIQYAGGQIFGHTYPGAEASVGTWAAYNGCSTDIEVVGALHIVGGLGNDETTMRAYTGCPNDGAVELWTIENGPHIPSLLSAFGSSVIDWFYAHPNA